jgi:hypothetical protein
MVEKLKPLRSTPTGIYFRMADGRIGYANHQYARVSVTREGIRNGEYYKEDNEIGDRMYQINKKDEITREHTMQDGSKKTFTGLFRIKYNDISEAISALQLFNCKNCGESAVEYRKNKILKEYKKHKALNIRSVLTRDQMLEEARDAGENIRCYISYNRGHNDGKKNGYNDGFRDGVASIEDKLNKLLNNL